MNHGRIGDYWYYDLGETGLGDVVRMLRSRIIGLHALNTAFDSGLHQLRESLPEGWISVDGHAVSGPLTESDLDNWPLSHDEYCDEWYFFRKAPNSFNAGAFCNFVGMRISKWQELEFEGGMNLSSVLMHYRPEVIVGNNENTYVVSRESIDWVKNKGTDLFSEQQNTDTI